MIFYGRALIENTLLRVKKWIKLTRFKLHVQVNNGEVDEEVFLKLIEEENLMKNKKNKKLTKDEI